MEGDQTDRSGQPGLERSVTIANELGLHARCAVMIVKAAQKAAGPVCLVKDGEQVDAKSWVEIMGLAAGQGTQLTVAVNRKEDAAVLNEISTMVEERFGE